MTETVKPLNISLFIRGSRYICLVSGIIFGIIKHSSLTAYEHTARPKRLQMYKEEKEKERLEILNNSKAELRFIIQEFNIPEIPLGTENYIE